MPSSRRNFLISVLGFSLIGGPAMAVEEPEFRVELRDGDCEIRDYPELLAAEVTVAGDRGQAVNRGFRLLAGYIFGGNSRREHIAMTAPVLQSSAAAERIRSTAQTSLIQSGGDWMVRFTMPHGYTLASLPQPNDPKVVLKPVAPLRAAVVRFSGLTGDGDLARESEKLASFIKAHDLRSIGATSLARYDPPWTPWFMRRNELMTPIAAGVATGGDARKP
jgi:hypothetical protein